MEASALLAAFTLAALRRNAVLAGEGTGTSRDAREGWQVPPVASRLLSGGPPRRRQALYLSGGEFQSLDPDRKSIHTTVLWLWSYSWFQDFIIASTEKRSQASKSSEHLGGLLKTSCNKQLSFHSATTGPIAFWW